MALPPGFAAAAPPPSTPPESVSTAQEADAPGPRVHIDSSGRHRLRLYAIDGDGRGLERFRFNFRLVCHAPCDRPIEAAPGTRFFVSERRYIASPSFTLDDKGAQPRLHVRPGHRALRNSAWFFTLAGTVLSIVGIAYFAKPQSDRNRRVAIGTLSAGLGSFALALPFFLTSRTRVRFD